MTEADKNFIDTCKKILEEGNWKDDRTGTGTYSIFQGWSFTFMSIMRCAYPGRDVHRNKAEFRDDSGAGGIRI